MSTEENKAIVRRYNEEVWSQGDLAKVDEFVAADFLWGADHVDPAGVKQFVAMVRSVFPDFQVTIQDMIAEGDKVAIRMTHQGTHQGEWTDSPLGTLPPTGRRVMYTGNVLYRLANQKIVEDFGELDLLSLFQQLGAIPAPQ